MRVGRLICVGILLQDGASNEAAVPLAWGGHNDLLGDTVCIWRS